MKKIENKQIEENFREYLKKFIELYDIGRSQIGIPLDREKLEELIDEINISIYSNEQTTGTFNVNQSKKEFNVIKENFDKNGNERNQFLLYHEMTHLSSCLQRELTEKITTMKEYFDKFKNINNNKDMTGFDVYRGLIGIEEVLAQWCCEECYAAMTGKQKTTKIEQHEILGNKINVNTSFSNKDIYAPLEEYVKDFARKNGYKDFREFVIAIINGKNSIVNLINEENIETLGYIGILCEGIYQENGFCDYGLPSTDIPIAITYLENRKKEFVNLTEGNPGEASGGNPGGAPGGNLGGDNR